LTGHDLPTIKIVGLTGDILCRWRSQKDMEIGEFALVNSTANDHHEY